MRLADRIRIARKLKEMSQKKLAEALDVQRSTVANWEGTENITPGADRMRRLASVLNVSFEWLATGRGEMNMAIHIHDVPAIEGLLVLEDAGEIRLVLAWRNAPVRIRQLMLEMAESRMSTKLRAIRKSTR